MVNTKLERLSKETIENLEKCKQIHFEHNPKILKATKGKVSFDYIINHVSEYFLTH